MQSQLEKLAQALLKYETLDGKEIDMILAGKKLTRETVIISETAKKKKAINEFRACDA